MNLREASGRVNGAVGGSATDKIIATLVIYGSSDISGLIYRNMPHVLYFNQTF